MASGDASREALLAELAKHGDGAVYRIALRLAGADPRIALRKRASIAAGEREEIARRLARMDAASPDGPWTERVLPSIAAKPALRAGDLAAELGLERLHFKTRVRKLKELGLTESLEVGYRLSPRGRALLSRTPRAAGPRPGRGSSRPADPLRPRDGGSRRSRPPASRP
jgi:hypothetical protein